ncbi:MAG: ParB/RepB/Spo0J family partition protein [Pelagibacterales bacterium]|nr:ParB/RepB/Spo0J family partition protein [Pelagibacterales bacterium]
MQQDKKLGRGLSALLGDSKLKKDTLPENQEERSFVESISLGKIIAGIYQPRKTFNQEELEELSNSIKENGLIQPIVVRKSDDENHYEIIAGERRFRAAKLAGLTKISAIVKKINNHEALELAIIENVQRSDLSLIEEALGYKQLIEEFSYTQDQVAKRVGKSRSHVTNLLRLLTLPQIVRELLDKKLISMGHARALINSKDPEKLAQQVINDSLNVRDVENLVRDEKIEKANENLNLNIATVKTEQKTKFVNSKFVNDLENELSALLKMETKIFYNSFKNNGKITIKFSEIEELQQLITTIKNN